MTRNQKRLALEEIEAKHGSLTPDLVVQTAKNPKHSLHREFDWNDASAAHQHRLDTARHLIASVKVLIEIEDHVTPTVAYVHDPGLPPGVQGYTGLTGLAKRQDDARQAVLVELERCMAAIERARSIAAGLNLNEYFEAILRNAMSAKIRITKRKKAA